MMQQNTANETRLKAKFLRTKPQGYPSRPRFSRAFALADCLAAYLLIYCDLPIPALCRLPSTYCAFPQQCLYFLPLPHGHGSFLPTFGVSLLTVCGLFCRCGTCVCCGIGWPPPVTEGSSRKSAFLLSPLPRTFRLSADV